MTAAVGIDLGTTNSCVAVVQGDQAKVVESVYGERIHPSVVSFHPNGETIAGPRAKERLAIDPLNTVYSFKRLLGQDLAAPEIRNLVESLPYDVYEKNGIPVLKTRDREATLPEVSAIMLRYLREMASETYGVDIRDAIITVPANFTDVQRASTKIAGRIAGFNVLRILNEPTAAALAYGFGGDKEERIAVYDLGGGTFDITIIELLDDIFEVLSTAGDNFLGGDDFDKKLMEEMLHQFEKKHKFDLHGDPVALQRLRSVAERAKCQLSSIDEVNATLRELATDKRGKKIDFTFSITRKRFNELVSSLVERTLATCEEALQLANLTPDDLDNVVLVGGSTRVPLVRQRVQEFFRKAPRIDVNPDEVVAIGAAINAFSLTQEALDPDLKPIKKAIPVVDPFTVDDSPAASGDSPAAMGDSAGLAQAVRSSRVPPPPGKGLSRKLDDPFAAASGLFGGKTDDPFSRPLGKLELESRKMPPPFKGKKEDSADLPIPVTAIDDDEDNLPALKEDRWDVDELAVDDEQDLPVPILGKVDLPVPRDGAVDLPTVPEGVADLPTRRDFEAGRTLIGQGPKGDLDFSDDEESLSLADRGIAEMELTMEPMEADSSVPPSPVSFTDEEPAGFEDVEFSVGTTDSLPPSPNVTEPIDTFEEVSDEPVSTGLGNLSFSIPPSLPPEPAALPPVRPAAPAFVIESDRDDRGESTLAGPFQRRGHHPLDEVAGRDGKEAKVEQHAAFTVPVNKAAPAVLLDVTPRGLGVATAGGYCDIIIERNAAIPIEQSRHFSTSRDEQTEVSIEVYQGESRRTVENTLLGRIELTNLRAAPRGAISIQVTFEIDTDGILNVKAINEETSESQSTTIRLSGGLGDDQVNALVEKYANDGK